jgi:hypothetical protein
MFFSNLYFLEQQAKEKQISLEEIKKFLIENPISINKEEKEYYSIKEVAEIIGVKIQTLYQYNTNRLIKYYKVGKKCMYKMEDIMEFMGRNEIKSKYNIQQDIENSLSTLKR